MEKTTREEINKLITLALSISVIILVYLNNTADTNYTNLNNSYNKQLQRNTNLENYYYDIVENQSDTISILIKENELLVLYVKRYHNKTTQQNNTINKLKVESNQCKASLNHLLYNSSLISTKTNYEDVMKFARNDDTKYYEWTNEYDCKSFTEDFIKNSISNGLYSCFARMHFTNGDWHAIAQYNTNRGIIYIEPQSGEQINLKEGMNYAEHTVDFWTDCIGGK